MRYLGSKIKLLSSIEEVIKENNIEAEEPAEKEIAEPEPAADAETEVESEPEPEAAAEE